MLLGGIALDWARRKVTTKRKDYRMGQALRRGLANPDGVQMQSLPVVQWQSCESTSAQWS